MYFIVVVVVLQQISSNGSTVTVVIRFVQRAANLAAAGRLVVGLGGWLPARYTRRYKF